MLVMLVGALAPRGSEVRKLPRSRASNAVLSCITGHARNATQVTELDGDTVAAGLEPGRSRDKTPPRVLAQAYLEITWANGDTLEVSAYKSPALAASLLDRLRIEQDEHGAGTPPERHGSILIAWRKPPSNEQAAILQHCLA